MAEPPRRKCKWCPRTVGRIPGTEIYVCGACDDAAGGLLRLLERKAKGEHDGA